MSLQLYNPQSQGPPKPLALWPWISLIFSFLWSFSSGHAVPAQITPNWTKCLMCCITDKGCRGKNSCAERSLEADQLVVTIIQCEGWMDEAPVSQGVSSQQSHLEQWWEGIWSILCCWWPTPFCSPDLRVLLTMQDLGPEGCALDSQEVPSHHQITEIT